MRPCWSITITASTAASMNARVARESIARLWVCAYPGGVRNTPDALGNVANIEWVMQLPRCRHEFLQDRLLRRKPASASGIAAPALGATSRTCFECATEIAP